MSLSTELQQLSLLTEVDDLIQRVRKWLSESPAWTPARSARALTTRILERVQSLRIRLEAPLV
ncbi:MAG: hypothetical protein JNM43_28780, partial [Planctomycetaceae bacterium]|nr:hypothetical protein [Planctomycetaceae bacterium]